MAKEQAQLNDALRQILEGIADGSLAAADSAAKPTNPEVQASAEIAKMSPTARQEYAHRRLVDQLQRQCSTAESQLEAQHEELRSLREIASAHQRLQYSHKSARWTGAVCVVAMAVGGGMISTFGSGDVGFGIGWSLLIVAGIIQLGKSLFDW